MATISAPGKLFLSGEWSVLELGNAGIVTTVDKRVYSIVETADNDISISIDDYKIKDLKCRFDGSALVFFEDISGIADKLKFIKASIETSLKYLAEIGIKAKPFKIRTYGEDTFVEVDGEHKKLGFGSSAASVVAVVASVLDFHKANYSKMDIFKLSAIVHYFAQGKIGSSFDIAASTFGGIFVYKKFDPSWLVKKMEAKEKILDIIKEDWPYLLIEQLEIPHDFHLIIGWTKESASTTNLVKEMNEFGKRNPEEYKRLMNNVASVAAQAIKAWKAKDNLALLDAIRKNEIALAKLGQKSGVPIETGDLKRLSETANKAGGAGKLSGAGGGDCGFAVCFDDKTAEKIKKTWKQEGIYLVSATIDKDGVRKE